VLSDLSSKEEDGTMMKNYIGRSSQDVDGNESALWKKISQIYLQHHGIWLTLLEMIVFDVSK
jgi:hypothetical protein